MSNTETLRPLFIRMHSGTDVLLERPQPHMIHLRDIAHHLARIPRFNGATDLPYSVAQHSVLVARLLREKRLPAHVILGGLLHDGHEAYLGDVVTPVKLLLFGPRPEPVATPWDDAVNNFDRAIANRFQNHLSREEEREIKLADVTALATEWRSLMPGECPVAATPAPLIVKPMPWARAEDDFVVQYNRLAAHLNLPEA